MLRRSSALPLVVLALFAAISSETAAGAQRTFVASNGNDVNPCSLTQPCRSFAAALAQTSTPGEVIVLDSAGYGPMVITQSVSIIAPPGVYAGISVTSETGITVSGSVDVALVGLTLRGSSGARNGIFLTTGSLRVERVTVSGFADAGITVGYATRLVIRDSEFIANNGPGGASIHAGIYTFGSVSIQIENSHFDGNDGAGAFFENGGGGGVSGVINRSSFSGNFDGVYAEPGAGGAPNALTFRNCVFSANSRFGLVLGAVPGATTYTQITDSEISDNQYGLRSDTNETVVLSNTTITRNGTGIVNFGGSTISYQDNRLYGNATDGSFSTTLGKQ